MARCRLINLLHRLLLDSWLHKCLLRRKYTIGSLMLVISVIVYPLLMSLHALVRPRDCNLFCFNYSIRLYDPFFSQFSFLHSRRLGIFFSRGRFMRHNFTLLAFTLYVMQYIGQHLFIRRDLLIVSHWRFLDTLLIRVMMVRLLQVWFRRGLSIRQNN